ncbi:(deoxy)nucleoside triphosphate pyrophosphohydrolase [uncultured Sphingomonas sp.]|uniref:(deoxy)nucleoside triphosphate pyrophosphohydrolase n=1 Tax=uncultured Sphingomonas sp. TaxID=158754 RepID=UPI0025EAC3B9|nr:(deoxy)nucleoside triphosphate pyrophosphohydrolase [uncultured Sphingomonas sp.]
MTNRTPLLVVAAALQDARGRVLMQQRPLNKAHGGLWEFPGGKVEPGETPTRALARELREELAIDVAEDDLLPFGFATDVAGGRCVILLLFCCRRWSGVPRALDASDLCWGRPHDLRQLPMPPLDVPLLDRLIDRRP